MENIVKVKALAKLYLAKALLYLNRISPAKAGGYSKFCVLATLRDYYSKQP
jgi:hypothetical protein